MIHYTDERVTLHHGDCLDVLRELPDNSVDAVVCDPPYGLEFMGREWDKFGVGKRPGIGTPDGSKFRQNMGTPSFTDQGNPTCRNCHGDKYRNGPRKCSCDRPDFGNPQAESMRGFQRWCEQWATECLRVLKPGGFMLAFGGTRTYHRLTSGIEDAGFEIRDSIIWNYSTGFPKSLNVGLALMKGAGLDPLVDKWTPEALAYKGHGTSLKPAFEPIVVARKPLSGTVAANVTAWGTGALNIGATRVGRGEGDRTQYGRGNHLPHANTTASLGKFAEVTPYEPHGSGRWPTNVVLTHSVSCGTVDQPGPCVESCPVRELDAQSGVSGSSEHKRNAPKGAGILGAFPGDDVDRMGHTDSGGASRFFPTFRYEAKAPTIERPRVPREGAGQGRVIEGASGKVRECRQCGNRTIKSGATSPACGHDDFAFVPTADRAEHVSHPTVKPLDLMRWLVRLVVPPGGTCLEPFAGSGTTAEACVIEGMHCIAIEREADYLPLIVARLSKPIELDLFGGVA